MPAPEPMLATAATIWPRSDGWIMQPKWDGFRLLVVVDGDHQMRAWTRHGTNLTTQLTPLLDGFAPVAPHTIYDGELVALRQAEHGPVQDFAAVCHAILHHDRSVAARLQFVAFDVLELDGRDLRHVPLTDRIELLSRSLPAGPRIHLSRPQPASHAAHLRHIELGFEGSVLKRARSIYRPGRQTSWRKHKARHHVTGTLCELRQDRDGRVLAICDVEGRRLAAIAHGPLTDRIGTSVEVTYSRIDADGGLREARVVAAPDREHGSDHSQVQTATARRARHSASRSAAASVAGCRSSSAN